MRTPSRLLLGVAVGALLLGSSRPWPDRSTARARRRRCVCSACHGFGGNSRGDTVPILAGADAAYLKKALSDYAAGRRPSPRWSRTRRWPFASASTTSSDTSRDSRGSRRWSRRTPPPSSAGARRRRSARDARRRREGGSREDDPEPHGTAAGLSPQPAPPLPAGPAEPRRRRPDGREQVIATIPEETLADLAAYFSSLR